MKTRPVEVLLSRLDKVSGAYPKWKARCPAHEDNSPSLSITAKDNGKILIHCFAGCGASDIVQAVGLELKDLYPDSPDRLYDSGDPWNPKQVPAPSVVELLENEIYRLRARLKA